MIAVAALVAVAATSALARPVIRWLDSRAVVDVPVARSSHDRPTLRGGGIAPAIGISLGAALLVADSPRQVLSVVGVAVAFGLLGLAEDIGGIPTFVRLGLQAAIATAAVVPLLVVQDDPPPALLIAVAVGWLVAFVNAFNFMDGINGISSVQAFVAGGAWTAIGLWRDHSTLAGLGIVVAAGALGFLPFNFPRARVFLGDVGSYFIGAWLAATAVVGIDHGLTPEAVVAPLVLYAADTGVTLVRRALRREPIFEPHRDHVYQQLVRGGWTHTRTTLVVAGFLSLNAALGAASELDGARIAADVGLVVATLVYLVLPKLVLGADADRSSSVARGSVPT